MTTPAPTQKDSAYFQHTLQVKNICYYVTLQNAIRQVEQNFLKSSYWTKHFHQHFELYHQTPLSITWSFKTSRQLCDVFYENEPQKRSSPNAPVDFYGLAIPLYRCRMLFKVYLNRSLIQHYNTQHIHFFDTVAHEFAHCLEMYLYGISKTGHSAKWYDIAKQCGCVFLETYRSRLRSKIPSRRTTSSLLTKAASFVF